MIIDIEFQATSEKITVKSKAARFLEEIPNLLLFDTANNTLYALGRTEAEIKHESPDLWARRPETLQFYPIYDVLNCRFAFLEAALRFYTHAIQCEVRSLMSHLFWGRWFDRYQYHLWLEQYETTAENQRQRFERGLCYSKQRRVDRLVINARVVQCHVSIFLVFRNRNH